MIKDPEIRHALVSEFRRRRMQRGKTIAVQELGLMRGGAIVDVAVVNGSLAGFEIKSDADTLRRLARQASVYGQVLNQVTLVVGEAHLKEARDMIPLWWGLMLAEGRAGRSTIVELRKPTENAEREPRALVELLWLEEARSLLARHEALRGFSSKPRELVWNRVCEVCTLDEISAEVRKCLKARAAAGYLRRFV